MKHALDLGPSLSASAPAVRLWGLSARGLSVLPVVIVLGWAVALAIPATRDLAKALLAENQPVELLTFVFLVVGGALGLRLAWRLRHSGERTVVVAFYAVFALGLLVIAGEEVAWGQWFLGFETPEAIGAVNTQGELTLHNHQVFNDHLEAFPLLFGLAGLVSVWLARVPFFREVASPRILLSWFALIAGLSLVDLVQDFVILHPALDGMLNWLDEVVEMLVGISGFLYVWLNARRLDPPAET